MASPYEKSPALSCSKAVVININTFASLVWYKIVHTVGRKVVHASWKYFKDFQGLLEVCLHQTGDLKEENGLHV